MENQYSTPKPEEVVPNKKGFAQNLDEKIDSLLSKIDDGGVFKTLIVLMFKMSAFAFLLGGVFLSVFSMFGRKGYFLGPWSDLDALGWKVTAVLGFVIGLSVSLCAIYFIFRIIMKRSNQLEDKEYNGILEYIYKHTVPTIIIISGEVWASLLLVFGILGLIAVLLGSLVYFPLGGALTPLMSEIVGEMSFSTAALPGDWDMIEMFAGGYFVFILMSLYCLISTYVLKEVYQYGCKLIINLIKFLPKLAIPLAIRKRNE